MRILKFTPMEREILRHRLEAADAIAEVFKEDHGIDKAITLERVEKFEEHLKYAHPYFQPHDEFEEMILAECCHGCTFFGSDNDWDISYQKKAAYHRAARSLGKKVGTPVSTW
jgi:hypothetical protein